MTLKVVTSVKTLMILANELGKARLSGDLKRIEEAKKKHDNYVEIIKQSDMMTTNLTCGDLK